MVGLVAQGVSNANIAVWPGIAPPTLHRHFADIHRRTDYTLRSATLALGLVTVASDVSEPRVAAAALNAGKTPSSEQEIT